MMDQSERMFLPQTYISPPKQNKKPHQTPTIGYELQTLLLGEAVFELRVDVTVQEGAAGPADRERLSDHHTPQRDGVYPGEKHTTQA